jgi:hypothetical protein
MRINAGLHERFGNPLALYRGEPPQPSITASNGSVRDISREPLVPISE